MYGQDYSNIYGKPIMVKNIRIRVQQHYGKTIMALNVRITLQQYLW